MFTCKILVWPWHPSTKIVSVHTFAVYAIYHLTYRIMLRWFLGVNAGRILSSIQCPVISMTCCCHETLSRSFFHKYGIKRLQAEPPQWLWWTSSAVNPTMIARTDVIIALRFWVYNFTADSCCRLYVPTALCDASHIQKWKWWCKWVQGCCHTQRVGDTVHSLSQQRIALRREARAGSHLTSSWQCRRVCLQSDILNNFTPLANEK